MKFTSADKLCVCVPLFHCFGVVLATMNCLTHGCTQVMTERFDPLLVLASIHKERCTALYGVPTMFIAELNHPMFDMFDLSCLRTGIMAGSLCPVELMKQVEEKMFMKVTSVYGLTEASPGMTHSRIDDPQEVRFTTVGHDFEFTEVKVIDPETGEECPPGVQGEMCNRGYNTMKGYYKNPEATAEVIDKNGFLHSGDLGIKDENGNYRITGRIKDMIIRGGENIYPREIEEFLYQPVQLRLIRALLPEDGNGFFGIGDPDQAIYGFRGASGQSEDSLRALWPSLRVCRLGQSYRASQGVLDMAQSLLQGRGHCGELFGGAQQWGQQVYAIGNL